MRTLETLAADAKPFPESLIETIPAGANKPALDYVSWPHYTQRLLLQHPTHEYEVTNTIYGSTWAVTVHITIDGQRYGGVGEDSTSPTSAESNAYKRACAHAGIGLHLYGGYWLDTGIANKLDDTPKDVVQPEALPETEKV